LVEQLIRNQQVVGSSPTAGSIHIKHLEVPRGSPYEYLNHAIFLGILIQPTLKPGETPYVTIGVYKLL
jgi:hypothetical protein